MSEKMQRFYKTIMLIILTVAITFIVTSVVMYNTLGKETVKYISNDSIGKTFETFRKFIENREI